jgi:hypothetical protein
MADRTSPQTVLATFSGREEAEGAVHALAQAGFPSQDIGYLAPGEADEPDMLENMAKGAGTGGVVGGLAGTALGVVAAGMIPGIGPVLAAGALIPIAIGAVTGASAGGTLGGLFGAAATQDQGLFYSQEVRSGRSLVSVTTDRVDEARAILEAAGGLHVDLVGQSDTAQKLTEQEPAERRGEPAREDEPVQREP